MRGAARHRGGEQTRERRGQPPQQQQHDEQQGQQQQRQKDDKLSCLISWMRGAGVWYDERLLELRAGTPGCAGPALGVFARTDIQQETLLCIIPRSAILSPRTTSLARILEVRGRHCVCAIGRRAAASSSRTSAGTVATKLLLSNFSFTVCM
jgi:hypothetical protein